MKLCEAIKRAKEEGIDLGQQEYLVTYQVMAYQKWSEGTLKNRIKFDGFPRRKDGHSNKYRKSEIDAWNRVHFFAPQSLMNV